MNENNQNKEGGNSPKKNYTALLITLIFTLFIVGAMHSWWQQSRSEQIPYSEFNQMLKDHEIESVVVSGSKITITPKEGSKKYGTGKGLADGGLMGVEYYTVPMYDPDLQNKLDEYGVATYEQASADPTMSIIAILVEWVLPIAVMLFIFNFMMKRMGGGGGLMNVGKNNARVYVQKSTGVAYLFITHNLSIVRYVSDWIGVMYLGRLVEEGPTEEIFGRYAHPYTEALLSAAAPPDPHVRTRRVTLNGEVPSPLSVHKGCVFASRCPRAQEQCTMARPELTSPDGSLLHRAACFYPLKH